MGIKRGVSLYSYQQAQFFEQMNLRDMIIELHDNLQCDGVEIIDEAMVKKYPFPDESFYAEWHDLMQEFNMKPVTMDVYLDTLQFRDHVMSHEEAAERLKRDLGIAAKMGFQNIRCLCAIPIDVIEMALPTAEELGVRIGKEIHAPFDIKTNTFDRYITRGGMPRNPRMCEEIIDLSQKKNSKYVGLVPDMGIFQIHINKPHRDWLIRHGYSEEVIQLVDDIAATGIRNAKWAEEIVRNTIPNVSDKDIEICRQVGMFSNVKSQDIADIVPYIVSIHGKCYDLTEVPGMPGEYEDKAVDYPAAIAGLKAGGYEGYINTEFEGQRDQQDMGFEGLCDEVEQVRRHHKMLRRLIGE